MEPGRLYLGDNLEVLRKRIAPASVDLIYLDPPFNSNRDYNLLFAEHDMSASKAQMKAFDDCWTWDLRARETYTALTAGGADKRGVPESLTNVVRAFCAAFPSSDMAAYIVMMAARLLELHRVLKPTGSLYLHCDPTASHYLKIILDSIFGPQQFVNEVVWQRTNTHSDAKRWSPVADAILFYAKGPDFTWHPIHEEHSPEYIESKYRYADEQGRRYMLDNMTSPNPRPNMMYEWKGHASPAMGWRYSKETMARLEREGRIWYPDSKDKRPRLKRYLEKSAGVLLSNIWTDIAPLNSQARERIGYPTQKPLALMERIIKASSNTGDIVLDPFCGCGTTIHAAQRLQRQWIGIDLTFLAIKVIERRMKEAFPDLKYEFDGFPQDEEGAKALAERAPHNFQEWAVDQLGGTQTGAGGRRVRHGGDRGIDGVLRFNVSPGRTEKAIIQVKGGEHVGPGFVRDLLGTIQRESAAIGVLVTLNPPTKGMRLDVVDAGSVAFEGWSRRFPRIQVMTVAELLRGAKIDHPGQEVAAPDAAPPGSWVGENMVLPGMEAGPAGPRKATVVDLAKVAADELAGSERKRPAASTRPRKSQKKTDESD